MRQFGIYIIHSILYSARIYVGSTTNFKFRWRDHLKHLRGNRHPNNILQYHFNKYGESDLAFEVLESGEYLDKNHLLSREQGWFDHFKYQNTNLPYFNIVPTAGNSLGYRCTEDTKQKLRLANLGLIQSKETIQRKIDSLKKPVFQYDLQGNFIKGWKSAIDAAVGLELHKSSISNCANINDRHKTAGGFIWKHGLNKNVV